MYPHDVTIINLVNEKGRTTPFFFTLKKVLYQDKQGVRTGSSDHLTDNQGYVQIPHAVKGYVSPQEYLSLTDKTNHWTIQEGDYIVKGEHDSVTFDELENLEGVRLIQSLENIDYASVIGKHFGVYLK